MCLGPFSSLPKLVFKIFLKLLMLIFSGDTLKEEVEVNGIFCINLGDSLVLGLTEESTFVPRGRYC